MFGHDHDRRKCEKGVRAGVGGIRQSWNCSLPLLPPGPLRNCPVREKRESYSSRSINCHAVILKQDRLKCLNDVYGLFSSSRSYQLSLKKNRLSALTACMLYAWAGRGKRRLNVKPALKRSEEKETATRSQPINAAPAP